MMRIGRFVRAGLAVCVGSLLAGTACATLVTVNGIKNGQVVLSGYFSYDNNATGTVGANQLTAFQLHSSVGNYSLAQLTAPNIWTQFQYNTASNQLTPSGNPLPANDPIYSPLYGSFLMSAASADEDGNFSGFYMEGASPYYAARLTNLDGFDAEDLDLDSLSLTQFQNVTVSSSDTVVTMAGVRNGQLVTSGYFSYDGSASGAVGANQLTGFQLQSSIGNYSLAQLTAPNKWSYFQYDTGSDQLTPSSDPLPSSDPIYSPLYGSYLMSAASADEDGNFSGFTVEGASQYGGPRVTDFHGFDADDLWLDSFSTHQFAAAPAPAPAPEPTSWAMFIGGFGLIGSALRRPRRKVASVN